ncbi:Cys-tRNA(Pro) deacylase [Niallia sp. NCCP-28]|uniref:Cys-tRNA(Pro) deacylase n=1 Tax=Niallia sp. NCCP-28 TaxID=2934712 RepID=UPI00208CE772|nr:Cys-tRNA(Pro) deacylase [Niallia sp. NCCP-28]GKU83741.1 Cys-tRNA(Pro)/Cys-tRNA(Cys) deacylase [Niallia sp. NCCP-28]
MAQPKTNAMRFLDSCDIDYEVYIYENKDGKIDGISVANKINKNIDMVYKTLVAKGTGTDVYVFIVPVGEELDLKKAAKAAKEKKVELVAVKDIQKLTGYIRGGCSPLGMKKKYETFIADSAEKISSIIVSGGKIGIQMELKVADLKETVDGKFADITH